MQKNYRNINILNKALICNNCVGARFYKLHDYEYNNPFMWNCIEPNEFVKLIESFDKINLNEPLFELVSTKEKCYVNTILNNTDKPLHNINLNYIHYLYNKNYKSPTQVGSDILYDDIINYVKEKYFERLSRMPSENIFLLSCNHFLNNTHFLKSGGEFLLEKLDKLSKNNNIVVILDKNYKNNKKYSFKTIIEYNVYGKNATDIINKGNYIDRLLCELI